MKVGEGFFLCFSPERVDPGNSNFRTVNIPKVVGGITPACTKLGALFYEQALNKVVPVSSTRVAEMVKLLENTFRMINIGLVNEMAVMCSHMGINVWEVIDAASTLGGRLKTGHTWTLQNRPTELNQNKSIYTLSDVARANFFSRRGFAVLY